MSLRAAIRRPADRHGWVQRGLALTAATAAAVAMGSITTPADAGTGSEWDRLATCESGGNWDINTGNGYYGGLQFSKGSWNWAGGTRYAAYPHQATRAEQIKTAERLLDMQHLSNAWPSCSRKVGLTHAELQSGSLGGGSSDDAPKKKASPAPASDSTAAPSGSYRVRSGDTLAGIASRLDVDGGWRALYRANDDRIANPNVIRVGQTLQVPGGASSTAPAGDDAPTTSGGSHRVRAGESLSAIARREGVAGGWRALYRANDDRIANPNLIRVGQTLRLP